MFARRFVKVSLSAYTTICRGMATRWGIASSGKICSDYVKVLQMLPREEHQVVAVAARKLESSQEFANKFNIPAAYGSYKELAEDKNVEIVYVGAIHPAHLPICTLMLNSGKHVLCEKPMGLNLKQVKEMTELARSKGVLLVEGYWSCHFPIWHQMKKEIEAGSIGQVKMVTVCFGKEQTAGRFSNKALGGGAMMDLGCYTVMAAYNIFKEKPQKIVASGFLQPSGADKAVFATLYFSDDRVATLNVHLGVRLPNNMTVSGSKGSLEIPFNFWNPSQLKTPEKTYDMPLPKHSETFNYERSEGFVYEAQAIRESLLKGETENPHVTLQDSESIMGIMDEIRRQVGVVYDVD